LRSAFGAGSLDGIELESPLGGVEVLLLGVLEVELLGAAVESVELGVEVVAPGLVELDGWFDIVDGCDVVLGSVAGPAVGFCDCSVVGAPCDVPELESEV
jgi:hypothetical protein